MDMKFVSKNDALILKNSSTCTVSEYCISNQYIDMAIAEISGRYPEHGMAQNLVSTMVACIQRGSGLVYINNQKINLSEGDVVCIGPSERYYWDGDMQVSISCTPPWNPDQYKIE